MMIFYLLFLYMLIIHGIDACSLMPLNVVSDIVLLLLILFCFRGMAQVVYFGIELRINGDK